MDKMIKIRNLLILQKKLEIEDFGKNSRNQQKAHFMYHDHYCIIGKKYKKEKWLANAWMNTVTYIC